MEKDGIMVLWNDGVPGHMNPFSMNNLGMLKAFGNIGKDRLSEFERPEPTWYGNAYTTVAFSS